MNVVNAWSVSQLHFMQYYVYILTNKNHTVLYVGITNDLVRRLYEHQEKITGGFTARYNVNKLIYFETTTDAITAIEREKALKKWSRKKKEWLIALKNPTWKNLKDEII